jgi:fido (protein-threonine AMPylation protein)
MHPPDCPTWEYASHPQRAIVPNRVDGILRGLATGTTDTLSLAIDTRQAHRQIFERLTPVGHEYYAGHYRGEPFRCLLFCKVMVQADPRVGALPEFVSFRMQELSTELRAGIMALDTNCVLTTIQRLQCMVALACRALVAFLTVHPYVNGNGHAGRLIVWSILGRYGYWPRRWPVDPPPPDPPNTELNVRYRHGDCVPFERYLLQALAS